MTQSVPARRSKLPVILLILACLAVLAYVVYRLETAPSTNDAYVYADTIDVVPEVNGRIIDLPVRDNQLVRQGDLLLRIDPRPYRDALAQARARLGTLDRQIELTQRSVNAQEFEAASAVAAVERARAQAKQASDTLRRMERLLPGGYVSVEAVDQARTAQRSTGAELDSARLQAQRAAAAVSGVDALVAQRAEVQAQISIAELNLEFTEVRAPLVRRRQFSRNRSQGHPRRHPGHALPAQRYQSGFSRAGRLHQLRSPARRWRRRRRRPAAGTTEHQLGAGVAALPSEDRGERRRSRAVPDRRLGRGGPPPRRGRGRRAPCAGPLIPASSV